MGSTELENTYNFFKKEIDDYVEDFSLEYGGFEDGELVVIFNLNFDSQNAYMDIPNSAVCIQKEGDIHPRVIEFDIRVGHCEDIPLDEFKDTLKRSIRKSNLRLPLSSASDIVHTGGKLNECIVHVTIMNTDIRVQDMASFIKCLFEGVENNESLM